MHRKKIEVPVQHDLLSSDMIDLNIEQASDLSIPGINEQVKMLSLLSNHHNSITMVQKDIDLDVNLKKAFTRVFKDPDLFAQFDEFVSERFMEYKASDHYFKKQENYYD